jgi:hypothetical protein
MQRNEKTNFAPGSSFRDPSGQVFQENDLLLRNISHSYKEHWQHLNSSGLYLKLAKSKLLIPHQIVKTKKGFYKTIKPVQIPFISYPYEWCFSQLKDAAITTLNIQKIALEFDMILKDASAYNIQFFEGKPTLIDTLSFEKYEKGQPWVAYRQFCRHFLAPLLLMKYKYIELNKLAQIYIDGIPLDIASSLLPLNTWIKPSILSHVHLHSKSQSYFKNKKTLKRELFLNRTGFIGLIDHLESTIKNLALKNKASNWSVYYQDNNYTTEAFKSKSKLVSEIIRDVCKGQVWDLGANIGIFSHMIAKQGFETISIDNDALSVETNYQNCKSKNIKNCLPLVIDLTNPTPAIGFNNNERLSLKNRGPCDTAIALALIHHLSIANNIPFEYIAFWLSQVCKNLIIEFIPKEDSQTQRLLASRKDIFKSYNQETFESDFSKFFHIKRAVRLEDSHRLIYLMYNKIQK